MSFRITGNMMFKTLMTNVRTSTTTLGDLQEQMVSMRRINRPSDDPTGASRAQGLRNNERDYGQFMDNIDQARGQLDYTASVMEIVSEQLVTVRGKVMSGINPTADDTNREVIAAEIDDILRSLVSQANSSYGGMHVFGGTQTQRPPFEIDAEGADGIQAVSFHGNSGRIRSLVGTDHRVDVNEDPVEVFMPRGEPNGMFQTLIDIRKILQNKEGLGDGQVSQKLSAKLENIDKIHDDAVRALGRLGTRSRALQVRRGLYEQAKLAAQTRRSEIEDADIADVALRLQNQQVIFQAVLSASSTVYNSGLMDFLK